jgi:hypothetical protein
MCDEVAWRSWEDIGVMGLEGVPVRGERTRLGGGCAADPGPGPAPGPGPGPGVAGDDTAGVEEREGGWKANAGASAAVAEDGTADGTASGAGERYCIARLRGGGGDRELVA